MINVRAFCRLTIWMTIFTTAASPNAWATEWEVPTDSLRIINGKRVHEVERKDTLYAIARMYELDINALLSANPSVRVSDDLQLGQILQLPSPIVLPQIPDVVAV